VTWWLCGEGQRIQSVSEFPTVAREWVASYQGRTANGIRPETLADYRFDISALCLRQGVTQTGAGAILQQEPTVSCPDRDLDLCVGEEYLH
jgi:hypothetical protein